MGVFRISLLNDFEYDFFKGTPNDGWNLKSLFPPYVLFGNPLYSFWRFREIKLKRTHMMHDRAAMRCILLT